MDDNEDYKEVRYERYCQTCKFKATKQYEEPCNKCLEEYTNLYTEKPVRWEENSR